MATSPPEPRLFASPRWPRFTRVLLLALTLAAGAHATRDFAESYNDLRSGARATATSEQCCSMRELPEGIEKLADGLAERTAVVERQASEGRTRIAPCEVSSAPQGALVWLLSTNPTFPRVARLSGPIPVVNGQFSCLGARWKPELTIPGAVVARQIE